jgi:glycosyltransferase involved in cell wall biosynthesis
VTAPQSAGPLRICFVLPSLNGGGAERAAVQILNALDATRWDRSMYLFAREGRFLADVDRSVRLASGTAESRLGRWVQLRRHLQAVRPDIVMSFLSYFSVLTAARAAGVGARVVFNQQTPISAFLADADYAWRRPWHRRLFSIVTRRAYGVADAIVATSTGVADDLVRVFGVVRDRIRVLHNPVDLDAIARAIGETVPAEHEAAAGIRTIVAAGRLADAKNYPLLLDAFAIVRRSVAARLVVLGAGERDREIRDQIARLGIAADVLLCGFQSNPWKYMARADVFALTSRYEGFGNVLVEAMACGAPVVATRSPGTQDIVRDGVDGVLVDRHTPEAVAAALEGMLRDDDLRRRMADAARRGAARFALPAIADQYDRMLRELATC